MSWRMEDWDEMRMWRDWDRVEVITSTHGAEQAIPKDPKELKLLRPGAFRFNDGTTQGWTIDQLYGTKSGTYIEPHMGGGFVLTNQLNLALSAGCWPLMLLPTDAAKAALLAKEESFDLYLESPDLRGNSDWQGIKGYSLDVQRAFSSTSEDSPPHYDVQLQVKMWDKKKKEYRPPWFEAKPGTKKPVLHRLKLFQLYHIIWKPGPILANPDPDLELAHLRIRFILQYPWAKYHTEKKWPPGGSSKPKGWFLVMNVNPEW